MASAQSRYHGSLFPLYKTVSIVGEDSSIMFSLGIFEIANRLTTVQTSSQMVYPLKLLAADIMCNMKIFYEDLAKLRKPITKILLQDSVHLAKLSVLFLHRRNSLQIQSKRCGLRLLLQDCIGIKSVCVTTHPARSALLSRQVLAKA